MTKKVGIQIGGTFILSLEGGKRVAKYNIYDKIVIHTQVIIPYGTLTIGDKYDIIAYWSMYDEYLIRPSTGNTAKDITIKCGILDNASMLQTSTFAAAMNPNYVAKYQVGDQFRVYNDLNIGPTIKFVRGKEYEIIDIDLLDDTSLFQWTFYIKDM